MKNDKHEYLNPFNENDYGTKYKIYYTYVENFNVNDESKLYEQYLCYGTVIFMFIPPYIFDNIH